MANEIIAEYVHWRDTCDVSNLLSCGVIILGKLYVARLQITGLVKNLTSSTWN